MRRITLDKRKKIIKMMMQFLASVGVIFTFIAILMLINGGDALGISFPRNDIVHIGFLVVGIVYLVSATGMYIVLKNKTAMIEDNDERNKMIQAISGLISFGVQTLLFFSSLFILCFMGYLNIEAGITLFSVSIVSIFIFVFSNRYLKKIM